MNPDWPGGPPPGWYPDPAGVKAWRWWDGQGWTGFASDPSAPHRPGPAWPQTPAFDPASDASRGPSPGTWVHDRFAAEVRAGPWARRALAGYLAVILVGLLAAWAERSAIRQLVHNIDVERQTGVVQDQALPSDLNLLTLLNLVLIAPFYILFLRWQFEAAKTAQFLSVPARRSPGLGVGSWFIPVVNLWFPYQSIRDCLPPGDPGRTVVARMWALFIGVLAMNTATAVLALLGSPIGFVFAAVTLALGVGFALEGRAAVELIADTHRRLLSPGPSGPGDRRAATGP